MTAVFGLQIPSKKLVSSFGWRQAEVTNVGLALDDVGHMLRGNAEEGPFG